MEKVRMGIIGIGNMGTCHACNIKDGRCPEIELAAVADINPKRLDWAKENLPDTVARFDDAIKMLDSGLIDAFIIAVPHYLHPQFAIEGFKRGLHVMCEKPAGVYTKQVREMNKAAAESNVKFGMMFNQRTDHIYRKMKEIMASGELGELKRTSWIITDWYRTQSYYDSGSWRATWSGEGGGVLLNQAPHNLDIWQWIFGMPDSVTAFCSCGKYHNITVEDDAEIYAEYKNGATATFITSTGEYPGTNRLEITGDKGKLVIENGVLKLWTLPVPERKFCFTNDWGDLPSPEYSEFPQTENDSAHIGILQNFANAILFGEELIAPGCDGINELTISNAAYLSSWKNNCRVDLPFDCDEFESHLNALRKNEISSSENNGFKNPEGKYSSRWKVNW